jgi:AcrR family transcriptional regulator
MGVADRKEREKEEMKTKILEAAKKLFLDHGFEKTSIRNIAEEIEYSPGTIYLYFKDKNELLFALHQEAFQGLIAKFIVVAPISDPFEQLIAMGHEYLKFAIENPELYELMFLMTAPIEALECRCDVWEDGHTALNLLIALIDSCKTKGYFKGQDSDDLAMMIWANVHGFASLHLRKRMSMFPEEERIPRLQRALEVMIESLRKL